MNDIPIELKKEFNLDDKEEKKIDFEQMFLNNKTVIYSLIFYTCFLAIGTVFYRLLKSNALDLLLKPNQENISKLFGEHICNYMSLFLITVFLSFCLIGYGIINVIPCIVGLQIGMKTAYLYINYQAKGVGYAILMIAPFAAAFLTVLIYAINAGSDMSKQIVNLTKNQGDFKFDVKPTMKKFLIYGIVLIITSAVSALLETLIRSVVTI